MESSKRCAGMSSNIVLALADADKGMAGGVYLWKEKAHSPQR